MMMLYKVVDELKSMLCSLFALLPILGQFLANADLVNYSGQWKSCPGQ